MMRWTIRRKIQFIDKVLQLDDDHFQKELTDNNVSYEEFCQWHKAFINKNPRSLRVSRRAA